MKLYDYEASGNCYKARLLLSLLGLDYERVTVDLFKGEHKQPSFLRLNPRGQVPVLADGDTVIWDSMAILVYLARRHGKDDWLPAGPVGHARVAQWLAVSENEILYGLARARAVLRFQRPWNLAEAQWLGGQALDLLENTLQNAPYLALSKPSIADVACYPYVALAPEAGLALDAYPAIRDWIRRMQGLPGYVPLPGA